MKIKQFRSILALAVVAASVTTSISPAQAFTWEELWGAVKTGVQKGFQDAAQSSAEKYNNSNNSDAPQAGGFSNDTPQTPTPPPQNNNSTPSSSSQQPRMPFRSLQTSCVKASGNDITGIGRDDSDSIVSVGQRAIGVSSKVGISYNESLRLTCAITRHPTDGKARIAFAIPDNSTLENVRLSIYVDGREIFSNIISRGQVRGKVIDITGASSYAYILQAINSGGDIYWPRIPQRRPVAN
jgi:hypothetical protein